MNKTVEFSTIETQNLSGAKPIILFHVRFGTTQVVP